MNTEGDGALLLRRLADIEEIKRLKARYFRHLDLKDWDTWATVFASDCVMEVPEAAMVVEGRDQIVDSVRGSLQGATTTHHGHMPEITITGPDTAEGIWAMFDYVEWPASGEGGPVGIQGYGHYLETYTRAGGEWCIATLRLERLRVDGL